MKPFFRIFYVVILTGFICHQCEKEPNPTDIVDIPDDEFLRYLILDGVDTNGDGLISYGEAEKVTKIYLDPDSSGRRNGKVSSVVGIEAFVNLDTLHCCGNQIKELDVSENHELRVLVLWNGDDNEQLEHLNVSNNPKLKIISVPGNQLTSLDISTLTELERLECTSNQLTNLDVSTNTKLQHLGCGINQLTRLDVSINSALSWLYCSDNQITNLDLANGYNFELYYLDCSNNLLSSLNISSYRRLEYFGIRTMPTLKEVCVWYDPLSPPVRFEVDTTGSPNVYFTTNCSR